MKITDSAALAASMTAVLLAAPALACEEYYEVDRAEAKEAVAFLKDPAADEVDQAFAIDTLICAKRVALRDLAARTALTAPSPSVRAQVLAPMLYGMNQVVVRFLPAEGLTREQADFVKQTPSHIWSVSQAVPEENCVSFHRASCNDSALQILGTIVHFKNSHWRGRMELGPEGRLVGLYWSTQWKDDMKPLPALIELR
ncbi:hypothetical protein LNKW23_06540 [Paralimibaculum aggregatum]|uniref:Uncharacterized protein n=1 Tax=Paralimibaculum aggregatum TaxID=3036245 RepID=A0ABQ6LLZ0_9RHOB|nr:hypothetical protein [Limibaculum sp. NKW23]GMG81441.1 hypothetical protein LNKW23_06540 [Limibaculum sp. NKW23]